MPSSGPQSLASLVARSFTDRLDASKATSFIRAILENDIDLHVLCSLDEKDARELFCSSLFGLRRALLLLALRF